jgi:hypothetical protein
MSTVTALYNLSTKEWTGSEDSIASNYCNFQIGFRSNQSEVVFDNLTFGYELTKFEEVIKSETFPQGPILYRSSSELYLSVSTLSLEPHTSYTVRVWAENSGERSTFEYEFSTPELTNTGEYENSSVPHPDIENVELYRFDEATRTWVEK